MRILNLGSLNLDRVYQVEHFVSDGETILTDRFESFCGGKGLNQSLAIARAGIEVYHAGAVGVDGNPLVHILEDSGVNTSYLQKLDIASGHAILQVVPEGQNAIIVCSGANGSITKEYIDQTLEAFQEGDLLLVQNEISFVGYAIERAKARGMKVAFNVSPINALLETYPLEMVDYFLINEVEGRFLAKSDDLKDDQSILMAVHQKFPQAIIILTVGKNGVYCCSPSEVIHHGVYDIKVVDTTAAGDTFCGYFLASIAGGASLKDAICRASCASNIAVGRKGASTSIPYADEVDMFMKTI